MSTSIEPTLVSVRRLTPADLRDVVALDAKITGRAREQYLRHKLSQALADTGIQVSLAVETGGRFGGFLLGRVYHGEFGVMEPTAVLDTIGVHPDFRGLGIGQALLRQLRMNLLALGVTHLRTEVGWDDQALMGFFHHEGFRPAARLCLDLDLALSAEADDRHEGAADSPRA